MRMTVLVRVFAAVAIAVLSSGCKTMSYRVGQEAYDTKEEAVRRVDQINKDLLEAITPTKTPMHGSARLVIPTLERIKRTAVFVRGNIRAAGRDALRDMVDYNAQVQTKNLELMFNYIQKREIFDRVSLVRSPSPEDASAEDSDYVIYLFNPEPNTAQWYVRGKNWSAPQPILVDNAKHGVAQTISWLDYLEDICLRAAGK